MKKLAFSKAPDSDLAPLVGDGDVVAFKLGADDVVYCVVGPGMPVDADGNYTGGTRHPQDFRILGLRGHAVVLDFSIRGAHFDVHGLEPFGDDILLLVAHVDGQANVNAKIYGRDGMFKRDLDLAWGINDAQALDGTLWTSFDDEAIYSGAHQPGLVAWDENGERVYEYLPEAPLEPVDDCYAINLTGAGDIWCYYYSAFCLVHLHRHAIASVHAMPIFGSHAFAVAGGYVLFDGGYRPELDSHARAGKRFLVRLAQDGAAHLLGQVDFLDGDNAPIVSERSSARGGKMAVLSKASVYIVPIGDIVISAGCQWDSDGDLDSDGDFIVPA